MPNSDEKRNPFVDSMNMQDGQLKLDLRCAICNEPVQVNQPHTCKEKENNNANSTDD